LLPALGGDVVVGAGVDHAVGGVGVGQVIARLPAVEGELHDLHAGASAGGQQGFHLVGQVAQVLGDDRIPAHRLVHGVQKRLARAFDPLAALGGGAAGGDGKVAFKPAEMVDPHHVVDGGGVAHPLLPPGEAFGLVAGPVEIGRAHV